MGNTTVYRANDVAINAYLLRQGELSFKITDKRSFNVRGQNLVFGAGEVLRGVENKRLEGRLMNVTAKEGSQLAKIPNENLKRYIRLYNIGFSITKFIAECVRQTNTLLTGITKEMDKQPVDSRRYYRLYYFVIDQLREQAEPINNSTILGFANMKEDSVPYRTGKLFSPAKPQQISVESRQLDTNTREFPAGSFLCHQTEPANSLFILQKGKIRVLLNNDEIALINRPGTIMGEMSLFLNEPRTATLTAAEDSIVNVVNQENLPLIAEKMPNFFNRIAITMQDRLRNNVEMIRGLEKLDKEHAKIELQILNQELLELYRAENLSWITKLRRDISNTLGAK